MRAAVLPSGLPEPPIFERKGDMSDLRLVIFLKFVRFGANFAQTVVLGYSLMNKS